MTVPEAPVHEDHRVMPGKHHVWPAGEVFGVQTVAKTHRMDEPTQAQFWHRISAAHLGHNLASPLFAYSVHPILG